MPLSDILSDPYGVYRARKTRPQDQEFQDDLGPEEHRQMLEEISKRNPALGTILALFAPLYSLGKMIGVNLGGTGEMLTSRPSLEEIGGAWTGYGQGLMSHLK